MRWLDLEGHQQGGEIDEEKIKAQIDAELHAAESRDKKEDEQYAEKKQELMTESAEREKSVYDAQKAKMRIAQAENNKDLNVNVGESGKSPADMMVNGEYAIYDNYDPNSKHNKIVRKIQQDANLTEEEKEFLMKNHEGNMHNIESIMEGEKKRQDQEFDRALRDRMERRKRLKEKLFKKDIKQEQRELEHEIETDINYKRGDALDAVQAEHERALQIMVNAGKDDDYHVKQLEAETEKNRIGALDKIQQERDERIAASKEKVLNDLTKGAVDDQHVQDELRKLIQADQANFEQIIASAQASKKDQDESIAQKVKQRIGENEDRLIAEKAKFDQQLQAQDIIVVTKQESIAEAARLRRREEDVKAGLYADDGLPKTAAQTAARECEERKEAALARIAKLHEDFDNETEAHNIIQLLKERDEAIGIALED